VTDQLKDRFKSLAEPRDDSSWQDVRRRARRRPFRPAVLLVAAALLAVLVTAPALGLHRHVVSFLESEPAPPEIRTRFEEIDIGAPKGMESGVIAGETRRVRLPDGSAISVAPTKAGGFCTDSGCIRSPKELAAIVERMGDRPGDRDAYRIPVGFAAPVAGLEYLEGNVLDERGEAIVLEYEDGRREEIPFVWVTDPINAGFWRKRIRREDQLAGRRPSIVFLLDGKGNELARDRVDDLGARPALPNPDGSPADADLERKRTDHPSVRSGREGRALDGTLAPRRAVLLVGPRRRLHPKGSGYACAGTGDFRRKRDRVPDGTGRRRCRRRGASLRGRDRRTTPGDRGIRPSRDPFHSSPAGQAPAAARRT
jgi:hypothetical protein